MIRLYLDENVRSEVTRGLRSRRIDCITAIEDGHDHAPDELVLARATHLGRVVLTYDEDFLAIAHQWINAGRHFPGVVRSHPIRVDIGTEIEQLALLCGATFPGELDDTVTHLPIH